MNPADDPLRTIALDDEPGALRSVRAFAARTPQIELIAAHTSQHAARADIAERRPDLLLVDVEMPGGLGTDFVAALPEPRPLVVFATAYPEHAARGFGLDAVDYLVKPFAYERFRRAVAKARELFAARRRAGPVDPEVLTLQVDYGEARLPLAEITHAEALDNYVRIFRSTTPKPLTVRMTLTALADRLPAHRFYRVHRSAVVALAAVEHVRGYDLTLRGGRTVRLGRSYAEQFRVVLAAR